MAWHRVQGASAGPSILHSNRNHVALLRPGVAVAAIAKQFGLRNCGTLLRGKPGVERFRCGPSLGREATGSLPVASDPEYVEGGCSATVSNKRRFCEPGMTA
jgi:hypothetical protein